MDDKTAGNEFAELRNKALTILKKRGYRSFPQAEPDLDQLLEELNIYQIELEQQNQELRSTQLLLEQREQMYSSLFEQAPAGYCITDSHGKIININARGCALIGSTRDQLINRRFDTFIHPESQDTYLFHLRRTLKGQGVEHTEITMIGAEGTILEVRLESIRDLSPSDSQADTVRTAMIDISDSKQTERRLYQSNGELTEALENLKKTQAYLIQHERLAAVGQLTAGIAHDFNNILTSILGSSELLIENSDTLEWQKPFLDIITSSCTKAAYLVRQLLDFSRQSQRRVENTDVEHLLHETASLLKHTLRQAITIDISAAPSKQRYRIQADKKQIEQVLLNLALNSRDATGTDGQLIFRLSRIDSKALGDYLDILTGPDTLTGEEEAFSGSCRNSGSLSPKNASESWILIEAADNGAGIPHDDLPHIFEPFFTTKPQEGGSGLGLPQIQGIMRQNSGYVRVSSIPGTGTTFYLFFPETESVLQPEPSTSGPDQAEQTEEGALISGRGKTVLLVEDNEMIQLVNRRILEKLEFRVIEASDGSSAVELFRKQLDEIDIVVLDYMMPGMKGDRVFHALHSLKPDLPIIMLSGYSEPEVKARLLDAGLYAWGDKPISLHEFSRVLSGIV
jgi:PAS domain S-box-containing protein